MRIWVDLSAWKEGHLLLFAYTKSCAGSTLWIVSPCWFLGMNSNQFRRRNSSDDHPDQIASFDLLANLHAHQRVEQEHGEDQGCAEGPKNTCRTTEAHSHDDNYPNKQKWKKHLQSGCP